MMMDQIEVEILRVEVSFTFLNFLELRCISTARQTPIKNFANPRLSATTQHSVTSFRRRSIERMMKWDIEGEVN
jgi:hypothetical protein